MLENRLITTIAIGYIIGIIIGLYCKISVAFLYFNLIILYIILKRPTNKKFKLVSIRRYKRYLKIIFTKKVIKIIIISSIISNSIILFQNNKIEKMYSNLKEVDIVATIVSNPIQKQYKTIYKVKVENISNNNKYRNSYLYLQTNKNQKQIDYGEKVKIRGTFIEPSTSKNYKGFNYKEYLKTQKIYGTIKSKKIEKIEKNNKMCIKIYTNKVFLNIKDKIQSNFDKEKANTLLGIIMGYTTEINENIKESFNESNISHILAVSGMHVGYIVVFIMTIIQNIIGKRKSIIITDIVIIIYMFITGFSVSVVRTAIMVVIDNIGKLLYRKSDIIQNISIAILITLINNPFTIKNTSVLLSYGAVLGIIIFKKLPIAFSTTIFILPIIAIFFNKIPLTAILVSSFIGIVVAPIIITGFIFIILNLNFLNSFLTKILRIFLNILIKISEFGSDIPMNKIYVVTPTIIEIIIYYIFIISVFYLYKIYHVKEKTAFTIRIRNLMSLLRYRINQYKQKIISILLILILIFITSIIIPKNLKIYFIDVGQGDSTLIVTSKNKKILIDGGGDPTGKYDIGKDVLIKYLLDRRIKTLDYIIISHFDTDHVRLYHIFVTRDKSEKCYYRKTI